MVQKKGQSFLSRALHPISKAYESSSAPEIFTQLLGSGKEGGGMLFFPDGFFVLNVPFSVSQSRKAEFPDGLSFSVSGL